VDVDISANDNFFDALANLLRQADYYHEIKGRTIVVLNKETKVYQIGVPAMKGGYTSTVGGNFLANKDAASGTEGTIKIASADNKFDVWENIEKNLTILLGVVESGGERVRTTTTTTTTKEKASESGTANPKEGNGSVDPAGNARTAGEVGAQSSEKAVKKSRQTADDGAYFVIDKSVGLITVTAKPVVLKKVENYLNTLKKQLYQQVSIEAKINEVFLQDN
jgi:general secretion pathway protein D/MSHA biogenesis protein MshL